MTFSAVGSAIVINTAGQAGTTTTTFSLTPNTAGDFILAEMSDFGATAALATAMSSSNATWVKLGSSYSVTNTTLATPTTYQVFIGTVTSTSTQTVTVTWNANTQFPTGTGQEFSSTAGASSVTLDAQGDLNIPAAGSTWASLTPTHGSGELYFGFATNNSSAIAGTTSGYVYTANSDGHSDGAAYNVSCPNTATAPVWGDTEQCAGIMVLVYEASAGPATSGPPVSLIAVNRPALVVSNAGWRGAGHSR